MDEIKKTARISGILYLIVAILAGFAQYMRTSIIDPNNVEITVNNIR